MSYRCKTCNKELEDYILVCDNCGATKIKVPKKKILRGILGEELILVYGFITIPIIAVY